MHNCVIILIVFHNNPAKLTLSSTQCIRCHTVPPQLPYYRPFICVALSLKWSKWVSITLFIFCLSSASETCFVPPKLPPTLLPGLITDHLPIWIPPLPFSILLTQRECWIYSDVFPNHIQKFGDIQFFQRASWFTAMVGMCKVLRKGQ